MCIKYFEVRFHYSHYGHTTSFSSRSSTFIGYDGKWPNSLTKLVSAQLAQAQTAMTRSYPLQQQFASALSTLASPLTCQLKCVELDLHSIDDNRSCHAVELSTSRVRYVSICIDHAHNTQPSLSGIKTHIHRFLIFTDVNMKMYAELTPPTLPLENTYTTFKMK